MLVKFCKVMVGFVGVSAELCPPSLKMVFGVSVLHGAQGSPGASGTHTIEQVFSASWPCGSGSFYGCPQVVLGMCTLSNLGRCELTCPSLALVMDNDNVGMAVMMMRGRCDDDDDVRADDDDN